MTNIISLIVSSVTLIVLLCNIILKIITHKDYNDTNAELIAIDKRSVDEIIDTENFSNCIIEADNNITIPIMIKSNNLIRSIRAYRRYYDGTTNIIKDNSKDIIRDIKPNESAYICCRLPSGIGEELVIEVERFDFCIAQHSIDTDGYNGALSSIISYHSNYKHWIYYITI